MTGRDNPRSLDPVIGSERANRAAAVRSLRPNMRSSVNSGARVDDNPVAV